MGNDDRNRSNEKDLNSEPNRDSTPPDRSGKPVSYPGGYGPAQGQQDSSGEQERSGKREPSREH